MSLIGKKFLNASGKICVVRENTNNMAIFEDNSKIETKYLLDTNFFTELPQGQAPIKPAYNQLRPQNDYIDPDKFLNQKSVLFEQISSIPNDYVEKIAITNEERNMTPRNEYSPANDSSAIIDSPYDEARAAEELAKKYNIENTSIDLVGKQANAFKNNPILNEMLKEEGIEIQDYKPQVQTQTTIIQQPTQPVRNVIPPQYEDRSDRDTRTSQVDAVMKDTNNIYMDPMIAIFKKSKMNTDFNFAIEINKKIPKLAYIEMMEESCETSIIEYLANEFTDSILRNPDYLKNIIETELRRMIEEPRPKRIKKVIEVKPESKITPKSKDLPIVSEEKNVRKSKKKVLTPLSITDDRHLIESKEPPTENIK